VPHHNHTSETEINLSLSSQTDQYPENGEEHDESSSRSSSNSSSENTITESIKKRSTKLNQTQKRFEASSSRSNQFRQGQIHKHSTKTNQSPIRAIPKP
jgi:hypothetical protein